MSAPPETTKPPAPQQATKSTTPQQATSTGPLPKRGLQRRASSIAQSSFNFGIPSNVDCNDHTEELHGKSSWRYKVVHFVHSHPVQLVLMSLLLLDVVLLFIELFLLANYPHCSIISRDGISCCPALHDESNTTNKEEAVHHRWLSTDEHHDFCESPYEAFPDIEAGCDEHKYNTVHILENVLFSLTTIILSTFFVELNAVMLALSPSIFFRQFFYLLDYVVITVSLGLEISFFVFSDDIYQSLAGILVIIRVWRFVRIGHGIVELTHELANEEYEKLHSYTEELENILRENQIPLPASRDVLVHQSVKESDGLLYEVSELHRQKIREKLCKVEEGENEDENGDNIEHKEA